jgi:hypothetical protein
MRASTTVHRPSVHRHTACPPARLPAANSHLHHLAGPAAYLDTGPTRAERRTALSLGSAMWTLRLIWGLPPSTKRQRTAV